MNRTCKGRNGSISFLQARPKNLKKENVPQKLDLEKKQLTSNIYFFKLLFLSPGPNANIFLTVLNIANFKFNVSNPQTEETPQQTKEQNYSAWKISVAKKELKTRRSISQNQVTQHL